MLATFRGDGDEHGYVEAGEKSLEEKRGRERKLSQFSHLRLFFECEFGTTLLPEILRRRSVCVEYEVKV